MSEYIERERVYGEIEDFIDFYRLHEVANKDKISAAKEILSSLKRDRSAVISDISHWISCEDKKPEKNKTVIICYYGSDLIVQQEGETLSETMCRLAKTATVTLGWIGEDGWYGADGFPLMVTPLYWRELPKAPECPQELIEQAVIHGEKLAESSKYASAYIKARKAHDLEIKGVAISEEGTPMFVRAPVEYDKCFCSECGEQVEMWFKFCPECGKRFEKVERNDKTI